MSDDDQPVTRRELRVELGAFKSEISEELGTFKSEIREELGTFKSEMRSDFTTQLDQRFATHRREMTLEIAGAMDFTVRTIKQHSDEMREQLLLDLTRAVNASAEQSRLEIRALDDRYREPPARVGQVERDLDEHRRDETVHRPPPRRRTPR